MSLWNKLVVLGTAAAISVAAKNAVIEEMPRHWARNKPHYEFVSSHYSTPKRVASMLEKYVSYQSDGIRIVGSFLGMPLLNSGDYMQPPQETFVRGRGDCEDYARLAQELLSKNGYDARILAFTHKDGWAHAVCVARENGRWSVVDLDEYQSGYGSLKEMLDTRYPGWIKSAFLEEDNTSVTNMSVRDVSDIIVSPKQEGKE